MAADPRRAAHGKPDGGGVGVLTVDDQPVFLGVAREVIEATAGFASVGEASSGREALALLDRCRPQLVLVDVRMPEMDGIETTRRIKQARPDVVVVLISIEDAANCPTTSVGSGAVALVRKQDFGPSMLRSLWATHGTGA
jgi:DNA-binding NarL/FixJ family response regulator